MIKKIILKFSVLILFLLVLSFVYEKQFYEKDIQRHSKIVNLVRKIPHDASVIYIAESSNTAVHEEDVDKRPISEILNSYLPELNVYDITKPASHAGIYQALLRQISKENQVKTVVVTLNLRSFNAQWIYSPLETSLQKSLVLLSPNPAFINRILLSFKGYDIKTEKERNIQIKKKWRHDEFQVPFDFPFKNVIEWDNSMCINGILDENNSYDLAKTELACHYIKAYGFQLDTVENPRIADFNEIIELAEERNWNLVFNLLAENTEKANELVGSELVYFMNQNAKILIEYFSTKGVTVVNNLNSVKNSDFTDQDWTTEHYAEEGRKTIAFSVAKALRKIWI